MHKKRLPLASAGSVGFQRPQPGDGPIGDPVGRVKRLRHASAPGLLAACQFEPRRWHGVLWPDQLVGIGHLLTQPAPPVAVLLIGMMNAKVDRLEAVEGRGDVELGMLFPALPAFLAMLARPFAACLAGVARLVGARHLRRLGLDVLQMRLADMRRAIARLTQHLGQHGFIQ